MSDKGNKQQKRDEEQKKRGVPKLSSDQDFLKAFIKDEEAKKAPEPERSSPKMWEKKKNRHGMDILDDLEPEKPAQVDEDSEKPFEILLQESFVKNKSPVRKTSKSVPLKKRLKRYPPVEKNLDLHGLTGLQAQTRARSFIQTCKEQGMFTVRIIVGKGLHSEFGPVLPDLIEDLVGQMRKEGVVLWSEWERKVKSRSGAIIVYLKQFD